jgi:hypothetical protein
MFRTSIKIIGTVLAAAIVVVPVASAGGPRTPAEGNSPYPISGGTGFNQAVTWPTSADGLRWQTGSAPKADPLAVGYLIGQGLSPSEVTSWTTGGCSNQVKPASCYAMFRPAAAPKGVDPLAVGYLIGQGLAPSEVTAWTTGICSHRVKDAACYAMFQPAATGSTPVTGSTGFQWGDAGIGAGFTLGIVLLLGGAGAGLFISRQNRHPGGARVNQVRVEV